MCGCEISHFIWQGVLREQRDHQKLLRRLRSRNKLGSDENLVEGTELCCLPLISPCKSAGTSFALSWTATSTAFGCSLTSCRTRAPLLQWSEYLPPATVSSYSAVLPDRATSTSFAVLCAVLHSDFTASSKSTEYEKRSNSRPLYLHWGRNSSYARRNSRVSK